MWGENLVLVCLGCLTSRVSFSICSNSCMHLRVYLVFGFIHRGFMILLSFMYDHYRHRPVLYVITCFIILSFMYDYHHVKVSQISEVKLEIFSRRVEIKLYIFT